MKKRRILLVVSILLLAALACNVVSPQAESPAPPAQPQTNTILQSEDDAPRISVRDAKAALDLGQAVIVDVRSVEAYAANHVAGAISIPLQNFENNINNLSLEKDQRIITYCTWPNEHTSARAAFLLINNGYTNVQALLGGFEAWLNAGLPTQP